MSPTIAIARSVEALLVLAHGQRIQQSLRWMRDVRFASGEHAHVRRDICRDERRHAGLGIADHHHVDMQRLEREDGVSMLSPLTREDSCTSRFTTSAPSRLAASSKDTRVRVEGSVNRLATVTPASVLAGRAAVRPAAGQTPAPGRAAARPRRGTMLERQQMASVPFGRR